MLKKIRTTELSVSSVVIHRESSLRGTEGKDTVCLGDLGLGLELPENGVLAELSCELSLPVSRLGSLPQSQES
jgi:hypothetical protein